MNLNKSFDNDFLSLADLNWFPWVGKNYEDNRVLLVGDSHYEDGDNWLSEREATRFFVNNQGLNSDNPDFSKRRFFHQIEKTLLNKDSSTLGERDKVWNNVSFFNLVQRPMATSDGEPTQQDFDIAWRNFLAVADIIKPKICIKYGVRGDGRLGYYLNNSNTQWQRDNINEFYRSKSPNPGVVNLTNRDHKMKIIFAWHPTGSRGFDYSEWAGHIKNHFPEVDSLFI